MILKDKNTRGHSVWTIENGDPMHGVYPTQYTSRMETASVKQEEATDTRIIKRSIKKSERKERGHEGEKSQTKPNYAKDLTIELSEGRESPLP